MSEHAATERRTVAATPQACFDAIADAERLHEWQGSLRSATVQERDDEGRPAVVAFEVDARVRVVRYRLRLRYDPPHAIDSTYLDGDFRAFDAGWRFTDAGEGRTDVALTAAIDPGRFVPGPVRSLIRDAVLKRALDDLERHVT